MGISIAPLLPGAESSADWRAPGRSCERCKLRKSGNCPDGVVADHSPTAILSRSPTAVLTAGTIPGATSVDVALAGMGVGIVATLEAPNGGEAGGIDVGGVVAANGVGRAVTMGGITAPPESGCLSAVDPNRVGGVGVGDVRGTGRGATAAG
jgi:hypothetical protein